MKLLILLLAFVSVLKSPTELPNPLPINPKTDIVCFANTIYLESGNQSIEGKFAVGFVIKNRMEDSKSPICEIVSKRGQFAHVRLLKPSIVKSENYRQSKFIAYLLLAWPELFPDFTNHSTFFYADYIQKPYWTKNLKQQNT